MPLITENGNTYWMPEVLPEPTKEYQATQAEKKYLTEKGVERTHPGWTYAENVAYVDDEYLFQNDGWKLIIDEAPLEPVPFYKNHYIKNSPEEWNEIDERTVEATYTLSGWIPEVFLVPTKEYQQTQSEKRYLTEEGVERTHPQWKYVETNAYVDDEYLFQNDGWKLIIDEAPLEPVSSHKTYQVRNAPEDWEELEDERTLRVTYTLSGWIPEVFPTSTSEYQQTQSEKRYLTPDGEERIHPQWKYVATNAYVDDEYLFQNEGWKLIIDDEIQVVINKNHYIKNPPEEWNEIDERTLRVTYTLSGWIPEVFPTSTSEYQQTQSEKRYLNEEGEVKWHPQWKYVATNAYVDDEYLFQNEGWQLLVNISQEPPSVKLKNTLKNGIEDWEEQEGGKTIKVTYTLVDFTEEEVAEYTEQQWKQLRMMRDNLLGETDWVIVRAMEENLIVSSQVTAYRQSLRDFPETIENILEFEVEFGNFTLWPIRPEVYFAV